MSRTEQAPRQTLLLRLVPLLRHRRLPRAAALLAVALCLPALGAGLSMDDYFHRAALTGRGPPNLCENLLFNLFNFLPGDEAGRQALIDSGVYPWWAAPDLKGSFLRPVTAATHILDYKLWPDLLPLPRRPGSLGPGRLDVRGGGRPHLTRRLAGSGQKGPGRGAEAGASEGRGRHGQRGAHHLPPLAQARPDHHRGPAVGGVR